MSFFWSFSYVRIFSLFTFATFALTATNLSHAANGDLYEKATAGTRVSFSASADGNPLPTFQWTKDGVAIPGATKVTLTLPHVSAADNGTYNVVATNSVGWALSNDLILTVDTAIPTATAAPSFTLQPFPNAVAPEGSAFTLSASAVGTPAPDYQWLKNDVPITGATNSTLYFPALQTVDGATYAVLAYNSAGKTFSQNSVLTVLAASSSTAPAVAPSFTIQPVSNTTVQEGTTFSLSAAAVGTPDPTYQWLKDGIPIPGATSSTLHFPELKTIHSATYSVLAFNSAGKTSSQESVLTVLAASFAVAPSIAPTFTVQPASNATGKAGTALTLSAAAAGNPTPTYQWRKNGVAIPGATNSTLDFAALTSADSATYDVVAANSAGEVLSQYTVLTVITEPSNVAPTITTEPYSQSVGLKTSFTFQVEAGGTPAPTYQWYKDGVAIPGATNASYTKQWADVSDAGSYMAVAQNAAGTVKSQSAMLFVK